MEAKMQEKETDYLVLSIFFTYLVEDDGKQSEALGIQTNQGKEVGLNLQIETIICTAN